MLTIEIKKAGRSIEVDPKRLPNHVSEYIFVYGLKQKLNDSAASLSVDKGNATPDEVFNQVSATLDRLYAGDMRATRSVDTVGRLAMGMALKAVTNAWLRANPKADVKAYTTRSADAAKHLAANPQLVELAQSIADATAGDDIEV